MTDQTIFSEQVDQAPHVEVPANTTQEFVIPPELSELVGAGKKYATVDAALKALPHSQTHISKLEQELAELRDEVTKRKTTQELLDEIKSGIPNGATTPTDGLNQDTVVKLVEKVISQKEQQQAASVNIGKIVSAFKEAYGDNAETQYNKLAVEAGLSVSDLNKLAATSPLAVLKIAGIGKAPVAGNPGKTKSDVNPLAFSGNSTEPSAKVMGSSTKDVLAAWRVAGEKVRKSLENS